VEKRLLLLFDSISLSERPPVRSFLLCVAWGILCAAWTVPGSSLCIFCFKNIFKPLRRHSDTYQVGRGRCFGSLTATLKSKGLHWTVQMIIINSHC